MVQDWIVDWSLSIDLEHERFITLVLQYFPFFKDSIAINFTTFLRNPSLSKYIKTNNIMLVEFLGPSLRNSVFDLVFNCGSVWTFGEGCS